MNEDHKENVKFLIVKLFFRDIQAGDANTASSRIRLIKTSALTLIAAVSIIGTALTVKHALNHYSLVRDEFLKVLESPQQPESTAPSAVWFTQELGDPHNIQGILAYLNQYADGELTLDIVNVNDIPVELLSVQDIQGNYANAITGDTTLGVSPDYETHSFTIDAVDPRMLGVRSELVVNYRYDDGIIRQAVVIPFKRINEPVFAGTTIRTLDNTDLFDFVKQDGQFVVFEGRQITIDQPLYIPSGKPLRVTAGQEIDLVNGAFIVVRTPVEFAGVEQNPVKIFTSDGSGRGVAVLQADSQSTVSHTIFDGLDTPVSGIWGLTGAVTFYESDVNIDNSQFINNVSEDGLNIIRSTFSISDTFFANTAADAFDADFCNGSITSAIFENTANDAIDVSGSDITITNTRTNMNGDKGISAGENSRVHVQSVSIENAVIGIASKDLSVVTGDGVTISNTRIALTLYIKKAEFGPAQIDLTNFIMHGDIDIEYLIQKGSTLLIDGQSIRPRSAAKESLLFEKMINGEPIR